ncbi:brassinosteroid-related acyltransferase 1 [Neltuma alba]|uniref:brassinosteroid-related acyltransferase 1 n=1 Tax=Neltuma alba TaxID=207710 RepID=UPI0010A4216B|nr:brassinosteroid-related acyltransferase 1 [Prosopis alba]
MTTTRHGNYVSPSNSALVSISRVVPVYPRHVQPGGRVLNLSNLDRQCPTLMYVVFFYNPSQAFKDLTLSSVFSSLKSGLEETLSLWYPAAGRLRVNQSDGKLNLWCNNEGAIIVEAHTPLRVSQLGDLSQYNEFFEKLVYKPSFHANFSNMPLVVVQVTKFGCGGYSIGIGTSHSLFDGPATYDFLSAWASNSEILKGIRHAGEVAKPVHERGILLSGSLETPKGTVFVNMPSNSRTSNHDQQTKAVAIEHLYQLIMQAASEYKGFQPQNIIGGSEQNNYVLATYHVSTSHIDYLKRKHFSMSTDHSPIFSTFEVLASHLWKARTKALGLGVRKEKKVCLQFAVDTRNKMVPPLPKGFSGNAYVLASVMMSVREVEEASYGRIVEKIREAKNRVNHAYVKAYVEALESGAQGSLPPLKELTLVSDWTRMPFHNVGFFHGKAACVSALASPVPQVAYFMPNPSDNGGVDVRIGLHPQVVTAFSDYFLSKGQ